MAICCKTNNKIVKKKDSTSVLLIGCPNIGKSSYFSKITWQNNTVGNIDKITISPKKGSLKRNNNFKIIDLPGSYTLGPNTLDESSVISIIFDTQNYDKIVGFISANNFKRDMFIIVELLESQKLDHLFINMIDELNDYKINNFKISRKLFVDVEQISCAKNINIKQSINQIENFFRKEPKIFKIDYGKEIENLISILEEHIDYEEIDKRFIAIQLLSDNQYVKEKFKYININEILPDVCVLDVKRYIKEKKRDFIESLFEFCFEKKDTQNGSIIEKTNKIDKWIFKKWIGIPLFILTILFIYFITFYKYAGGFITESINYGFDKLLNIINDSVLKLNVNNNIWIADFITDGILTPIFTIIGFLPNIAIIFLSMNILEQTGYLARVSVMMDKSLNKFGISGRSIITLITGIGCNIPSVMMARNSQTKKERLIIILISPLIICGARIIVFNWISSMLVSTSFAWLITFGFTVFSIFVALFLGLFFSNTLFRTKKTFFLTELPPWRKPQFVLVLKSLGIEILDFIKKVFTVIFILGILTFLLSRISPRIGLINEVSFDQNIDWSKASFLEYISYGLKYLFYPIGLGEDWRISYSLIAAFPAKEAASSTLETLFNHGMSFKQTIMSFNLPISSVISYFIFFGFYVPCFSTLAVVKREVGWKWMFIQLFSNLLFAYLFAFVSYNLVGTIEKNIIVTNYINNIQNILTIAIYSVLVICLICWSLFELYRYKRSIELTIWFLKTKKYFFISTSSIFIITTIANTFFLYN